MQTTIIRKIYKQISNDPFDFLEALKENQYPENFAATLFLSKVFRCKWPQLANQGTTEVFDSYSTVKLASLHCDRLYPRIHL